MKIIVGCDHAGFELKEAVRAHLEKKDLLIVDLGTHSAGEKCDYPDRAAELARAMQRDGSIDFGILICGTGIGMAITANKFRGIRASVLSERFSAEQTRLHNDANVLCLGGRVVSAQEAASLCDLFISTRFDDSERHARRVDKIRSIEKLNFKEE